MPLDGNPDLYADVISSTDDRPPHVQIIRHARGILSSRWRWTRKTMACTWYGWGTHPVSDNAVRFCAVGALERARYDLKLSYEDFRQAEKLIGHDIMRVNDHHGRKEVLSRFDSVLASI